MGSRMKALKGIWMVGLVALICVACNTITEDLQPCSNYVSFTYTRNMKYADAFPLEVKKVDLFVFDAANRFVTCFSRLNSLEDGGKIELTLPAGKYHLVAWAGLYERSYLFKKELVKGVSTPEELTVRMQREYLSGKEKVGYTNKELDALWHAEADIEVSPASSSHTIMDLTKNTNKIRLVLQMNDGSSLKADDLEFSITGRNGYLNFDNSLLPDDTVVYYPYYLADVVLKAQINDGGLSAIVAEMNSLRLMDGEKMRLLIKRKDGKKVVDIDLIQYLLLTKMEGHQLSAQEYLDRQDEYAMVFWLANDIDGNYMIVQIKINDWILRIQDTDF